MSSRITLLTKEEAIVKSIEYRAAYEESVHKAGLRWSEDDCKVSWPLAHHIDGSHIIPGGKNAE